MFRFIQRIQKEPLAVRKQFALWGTVVVTVCIILVWFAMLNSPVAHLSSMATPQEDENALLSQELSPFAMFQKQLSSFWTGITERIKDLAPLEVPTDSTP